MYDCRIATDFILSNDLILSAILPGCTSHSQYRVPGSVFNTPRDGSTIHSPWGFRLRITSNGDLQFDVFGLQEGYYSVFKSGWKSDSWGNCQQINNNDIYNNRFLYSALSQPKVSINALLQYYRWSLGHIIHSLNHLSSLGSIQSVLRELPCSQLIIHINHLCPHRYPFYPWVEKSNG